LGECIAFCWDAGSVCKRQRVCAPSALPQFGNVPGTNCNFDGANVGYDYQAPYPRNKCKLEQECNCQFLKRGPAAEEMSEAHPDRSLKNQNLLFLQRQCVVLSPVGCSLVE